jgi:hypothetical protein
MNDPFASEKQDGGKSLFTKFRETLNGSTSEGGPSTPTQQIQQQSDFPTMSTTTAVVAPSASRPQAHPRTTSEDIDDHMAGSVHQGADPCPSCGYIRMSSVYCPVSQLHHGTDLPAETPRRKKQSLFSRIRDSMSGITPVIEDSDSEVDAPTTNADASDGAAAATSPAQGISGLFSRSKEEKQLSELAHQEEKCRKQIVDIVRLSVQEIDRQLTAVHKEVREAVRANERSRNIILFEFKTEFDKFYAERKRDLEDIKKDFLMETKLMLKKEKERKKHSEVVGLPGVENAGGSAADEVTPPASDASCAEARPDIPPPDSSEKEDIGAEAPLAES